MNKPKPPFSVLRRTAGEVKRYNEYRRIIPIAIGAIISLLAIVYVVSLLFNRYGSFTVRVSNAAGKQYALTLAENDRFTNPSAILNSRAAQDVTNIDGNTLPADLNDVDGSHNGENYVAYTFYLKNAGASECSYRYKLVISRMTAGIDSATRVRIYYSPDYYVAGTGAYNRTGHYVDYAKAATGGNGNPEIDPENRVMTNFESANVVLERQADNFRSGDVAKFTVVIWIEGNDPDCTDDRLGGEFKLDMLIEIVNGDE